MVYGSEIRYAVAAEYGGRRNYRDPLMHGDARILAVDDDALTRAVAASLSDCMQVLYRRLNRRRSYPVMHVSCSRGLGKTIKHYFQAACGDALSYR